MSSGFSSYFNLYRLSPYRDDVGLSAFGTFIADDPFNLKATPSCMPDSQQCCWLRFGADYHPHS